MLPLPLSLYLSLSLSFRWRSIHWSVTCLRMYIENRDVTVRVRSMPSWFTSVLLSVVILGDDACSKTVWTVTAESASGLARCFRRDELSDAATVADSFELCNSERRVEGSIRCYWLYRNWKRNVRTFERFRNTETRSKNRYMIERSCTFGSIERIIIRVPINRTSKMYQTFFARCSTAEEPFNLKNPTVNRVKWNVRPYTPVHTYIQTHTRIQNMYCCTVCRFLSDENSVLEEISFR